jgi:hypothetical protein
MSWFGTDSSTETTQIWGKEFLDSMFSVVSRNSSFFSFLRLAKKTRLRISNSPPQLQSVRAGWRSVSAGATSRNPLSQGRFL